MRRPIFLVALMSMLLLPGSALAQPAGPWSAPVEVSQGGKASSSWFEDMAAEPDGTIHITWYGGFRTSNKEATDVDLLMHRELRAGTWSAANDVYNPGTGGFTVRNSIAVGPDNRLHALVRRGTRTVYLSAPAAEANNPKAWSTPFPLNKGASYFNALAVDRKGRIHAIYHEQVQLAPSADPETCACGDIYYRYSDDDGDSWSAPVNLSQTPEGSVKPQIKIGADDSINIVWEEGFDWYATKGTPTAGVYRHSADRGLTWDPPVVFTLPKIQLTAPTPFPGAPAEPTPAPQADAPHQVALGLFQGKTPVVVYRSDLTNDVFFQTRSAAGEWTKPTVIPGIRARQYSETPQDHYALTTDGAGNVHLLLAALLPADFGESLNLKPTDVRNRPRLMHLVWDGSTWSAPETIADDTVYPDFAAAPIAACDKIIPGAAQRPRFIPETDQAVLNQCNKVARYPEWIKAVVSGNTLHVSWFTRTAADLFNSQRASYQVWYSARTLAGPPLAPLATFTPAQISAAQPTAAPTAIPIATLSPQAEATKPLTARPTWEASGMTIIGLAALPAVLFLAIFLGVLVLIRRRRTTR